ncbi:MAG: hypothetical protein JNN12_04680 [Bacteroidetes Order II. Incertae sedis bacterium]|nr:hypothetical protein [Bacteroidetes Order II. bacterium]
MKTNNIFKNETEIKVLSEKEQKEVTGGFMPPTPSPYRPSQADLQYMLDRLREMNEKNRWLQQQRNMIR